MIHVQYNKHANIIVLGYVYTKANKQNITTIIPKSQVRRYWRNSSQGQHGEYEDDYFKGYYTRSFSWVWFVGQYSNPTVACGLCAQRTAAPSEIEHMIFKEHARDCFCRASVHVQWASPKPKTTQVISRLGDVSGCQEQPLAGRSSQEQPRAARSRQVPPGAARGYQEPPGTGRGRQQWRRAWKIMWKIRWKSMWQIMWIIWGKYSENSCE